MVFSPLKYCPQLSEAAKGLRQLNAMAYCKKSVLTLIFFYAKYAKNMQIKLLKISIFPAIDKETKKIQPSTCLQIKVYYAEGR